MTKEIVVLPGDGIGQEIIDSAVQVLQTIGEKYNHDFTFIQHDIGGTSYDRHGTPLTDEAIAACENADAILLGAIEGHKCDQLPESDQLVACRLKIRQALNI